MSPGFDFTMLRKKPEFSFAASLVAKGDERLGCVDEIAESNLSSGLYNPESETIQRLVFHKNRLGTDWDRVVLDLNLAAVQSKIVHESRSHCVRMGVTGTVAAGL